MAVTRKTVGLSHVLRMGSANHSLPFLAPVTTSVVALMSLTRTSTAAAHPVRRVSCIAYWMMSVFHTRGAVMATQTVLTPVMSSAVTLTQKLIIFQEENATTTRISTTMENETSFRNVTFTSAGDSSRNPSAYGVIAAAGVLSAILVSATLLILLRLRGQGYLPPPGLLVAVKESLLLSERKTSLI